MAKKSAKPAKRPAKKTGKKAAAKPAAKAPTSPKMPPKVTSGSGPSAAELGKKFVAQFNADPSGDWVKGWWHKGVRSIEGDGTLHVGEKQIMAKWAWWSGQNQILGVSAEGPYLGATGFAVRYSMHVKDAASGNEMRMSEVAVYTIKNGKIVQEEFMYGS
jgi:hypothetical protein